MKEKQIEEMAHNLCLKERDCEDCERNGVCLAYSTATIIYNAGYRKIPEGAVVLTEREHEFATIHQYTLGFSIGYRKGIKEAAREIFDLLQEYYHQASDTIILDKDDFYKLAKCYGVEVE